MSIRDLKNTKGPSEDGLEGEILRPDLSGKDIAVIRENLKAALKTAGGAKEYSDDEIEFMLTKLIVDNQVAFSKSTLGSSLANGGTVATDALVVDKDNKVVSSSSTILTLEGLGVGVQYVSIGGGDSVSMWW